MLECYSILSQSRKQPPEVPDCERCGTGLPDHPSWYAIKGLQTTSARRTAGSTAVMREGLQYLPVRTEPKYLCRKSAAGTSVV